jgi:hypothetical protein
MMSKDVVNDTVIDKETLDETLNQQTNAFFILG